MSKAITLLEILYLIEDDKVRTGTFIDPEVIKKFKERPDWKERARKYAQMSKDAYNEEDRLTYANMALGYPSVKARQLAKDSLKKELVRQSSEHDVYKQSDEGGTSGFERVAGEKEDVDVSIRRKEAVLGLIDSVKREFKGDSNAEKVLSANLIQHGFDEIVPTYKIPYYSEISNLIRKLEAGASLSSLSSFTDKTSRTSKTKHKQGLYTLVTNKPPMGLGVPERTFYKVQGYLKAHARTALQHESFISGLSSIFGGRPSEFKLSNLEPMEDIIKRDIRKSDYKGYGLHLQGMAKEGGEDILKNIPAVKHQFQGHVLLIPLEQKTELKKYLKKAFPGKKVVLFGFNSKPLPIRKGWEGFPYKLVKDPVVLGSYALSSETKSESVLKMLSDGETCGCSSCRYL